MSNIYDILETCLQDIENGADIDTVLFRYPEHADELRPILEASVNAKSITVPVPSADVMRRNRAKVLQHAAQLREAKAQPSRRLWTVPLRRALVSLAVVATLFVSSTGLVSAASTTIPGDNLYPVKRTWEDVLVLFTFDHQAREALEVEHESERLDELKELFTEGRSVQVDFSGVVTRQNGDLWLVAGIPVAVSAQTDLPTQSIVVGDAIHILGTTQADGAVLARTVELLPAGVPLPQVIDDDVFEQEKSGDSNEAGEDNSGKGSQSESSRGQDEQDSNSGSDSGPGSSDPGSGSESQNETFDGTVESINGTILVVNGKILNVGSAEVKGKLQVGATVKVEGYYDANGVFIVTKIEFKKNDSGSTDDNKNSNDSNDGKDDDSNSNDDSHNDNNDNSGSGGGDD